MPEEDIQPEDTQPEDIQPEDIQPEDIQPDPTEVITLGFEWMKQLTVR